MPLTPESPAIYITLLTMHSFFRYALYLMFLYSFVVFMSSYRQKQIQPSFQKSHKILTILTDIQFLMGLILYFISPLVQTAISDIKSAMKNSELRFFLLEHGTLMIFILALLHILNSKLKKSPLSDNIIKISLVFYIIIGIFFIIGFPYSRPAFRF
jgi:hypothetical protein